MSPRPTIQSLTEELGSLKDRFAAQDERHAGSIVLLKAEHEKAIATRQVSVDCQIKRATEAETELEQLHGLLDALPNALPRKTPCDPCQSSGYHDHRVNSAMTRLASWLALR